MEPERTEPTFTRLIVGKTWSNTKRFFKSVKRDLIITIIPAIVGFGALCAIKGPTMALADLVTAAAFTFGPIGFACVAVMFWYFWIAPAELAYEASRATSHYPTQKAKQPPEPTDWTTWRHRSKYNAFEFAAILSKTDPIAPGMSHNESARLRLIVEEMNNGKLHYLRKAGIRNNYQADGSDEISKSEAVKWAKIKGIDVSHIE